MVYSTSKSHKSSKASFESLFKIGFMNITLILFCFPFMLCGQSNYLDYHRLINRADSFFGHEEFDRAMDIYDSTFQRFDAAYVRDYLIAAQTAIISGSEERVSNYLDYALKGGYTCDCVESLPIFKDYIRHEDWHKLKLNEAEYRKTYASKVSLKLNVELSKRYRIEQDSKSDKMTYINAVRSNYERIKFLIDSIGFPSEKIIGLDDGYIAPNRINKASGLKTCVPGNEKVIATLLHWDNPITDIGMDKFITAMDAGLLHPRAFAYIFTFEKNYISRISDSPSVNKPNLPDYNFNFPFGAKSDDLRKVNADRAKFEIVSLEVEQKAISVQEKYGFNIRTAYW